MTSSAFPAHWRKAVDTGDASGFTNQDDFAGFFRATSMIRGCFDELSAEQKSNVVSLRDAYPSVNEAARRAASQERDASPRFIGLTNLARIPTLADLKPELAAIEAEISNMPRPDPWAKVIDRHNAARSCGK
ncbi:hypothetical protein NKI89_07165 [Mesorhizobium sp. M0309]|uniref:hypothetical protein n=1 Tax=Mesorhizobium sp. M0309 TaxID=2956933 RepID=UPI003335CED5